MLFMPYNMKTLNVKTSKWQDAVITSQKYIFLFDTIHSKYDRISSQIFSFFLWYLFRSRVMDWAGTQLFGVVVGSWV